MIIIDELRKLIREAILLEFDGEDYGDDFATAKKKVVKKAPTSSGKIRNFPNVSKSTLYKAGGLAAAALGVPLAGPAVSDMTNQNSEISKFISAPSDASRKHDSTSNNAATATGIGSLAAASTKNNKKVSKQSDNVVNQSTRKHAVKAKKPILRKTFTSIEREINNGVFSHRILADVQTAKKIVDTLFDAEVNPSNDRIMNVLKKNLPAESHTEFYKVLKQFRESKE